jgi:hypothetical protein
MMAKNLCVAVGRNTVLPEAARHGCIRAAGRALGLSAVLALAAAGSVPGQDVPEEPRIESVQMLPVQPQENDPALIWYDNFDGPEKNYVESENKPDPTNKFGSIGKSVPCIYSNSKDSKGTGNRKVFFGDSPYNPIAQVGKKYDEIYWRVYVKHQHGWTGGGEAKLTRATSIVSGSWAQAMIDHVWTSGESLTLDPASGVVGDKVVTTTYNDFNNLHWLGNNPASEFKFSSTAESGWWVCVETRCKLNTPGLKDGITQLWIDGRLECERHNMDFRGSYNYYGINAVFLEAYWNDRSPVFQYRWLDNFVISPKPIGPVVTSRTPSLYKTKYYGPGTQAAWEVELATDIQGKQVVWRSKLMATEDSVKVGLESGAFAGYLAGSATLDGGTQYFTRVRQQSSTGVWSSWSRWHQPFVTEGSPTHSWGRCDFNDDGEVNILDVIGLLLFQRDNPQDQRGDYNGDSRINVGDAVQLLRDIAGGKCTGAQLAGLSAGEAYTLGLDGGQKLSRQDREYIEKTIEGLPLDPEQKSAFELALYGEGGGPLLPRGFFLSQNSPNPFNPRTAISFIIPETSGPVRVSLKVFDLRNQPVRTLVDGLKSAGLHTVVWDGRGEQGSQAASGVYFYRIVADNYTQTRKMVLLR